jgi:hypothetical protein
MTEPAAPTPGDTWGEMMNHVCALIEELRQANREPLAEHVTHLLADSAVLRLATPTTTWWLEFSVERESWADDGQKWFEDTGGDEQIIYTSGDKPIVHMVRFDSRRDMARAYHRLACYDRRPDSMRRQTVRTIKGPVVDVGPAELEAPTRV